ncbi:pyroglutamyl-peptidase I [Maritalea sp.]|jgi:pyroglutamyl-peptidase|uniref:pyroglutamyl-peptidase I n=1 Tax=Maritalea sp. TaxID=2003361 RepID=UPI0039E4DD1A
MMQKILLTGFEPFGGELTNPSMEIVHALDGEGSMNCAVVSAILPVERFRSVRAAIKLIERHKPDIVVALGVAVGRTNITPEKVAINFDDFRIADNGGNQPIGEPISSTGPAAYFATLPVNLMVREIRNCDVGAAVSFSAGTFVCNHLMYGILDHIDRNNLPIRAGFIHVPQATEFAQRTAVPSLPLAEMVVAIRRSIFAAANAANDVQQIGGEIH